MLLFEHKAYIAIRWKIFEIWK